MDLEWKGQNKQRQAQSARDPAQIWKNTKLSHHKRLVEHLKIRIHQRKNKNEDPVNNPYRFSDALFLSFPLIWFWYSILLFWCTLVNYITFSIIFKVSLCQTPYKQENLARSPRIFRRSCQLLPFCHLFSVLWFSHTLKNKTMYGE